MYPPQPHPRLNAQAVFANGKVYWLGGSAIYTLDDATQPNPKKYWDNRQSGASIYDPVTNHWTAAKYDGTGPKGMDTNNDGLCGEGDGSQYGASQAFAYDSDGDGVEEIFIHAGYPTWDGAFFRYDPAKDSWLRYLIIKNNPWGTGYLSQQHGSAVLHGDTAYCFGGGLWGDSTYSFASCNLQTGEWTMLPQGSFGSANHAGVVVGDKMYILGGDQTTAQGNINYSTAIWSYDIPTGVWSSNPIAHLLTGVMRPGVPTAYNGKIYICGGRNQGGLDVADIQCFDPATNTVAVVGTMPAAMSFGGAAIGPDGTLYVGGGRHNNDNSFATSTHWWKANLNATPLSWTQLPDDPAEFPYEDWISGGETVTGKVTIGGIGLPDAIVGMSFNPNATADAIWYTTTDGDGNYTLYAPLEHPIYVAAWKDGFTPTDDVMTSVPKGGNAVVNFSLDKIAGKNIARGLFDYIVSAERDPGVKGEKALDGNLDTMWITPHSTSPEIEPDYLIVDLDSYNMMGKEISGITIWWSNGVARKYQIDVMNNADPLNPLAWIFPEMFGAEIDTVYACLGCGGGYKVKDAHFVDPILLNSVTARGVRLLMHEHDWPAVFEVREFMVHSATEYGTLVMGWVSENGEPKYNAAVQLGPAGSESAMITNESGFYSMTGDPGTYELYADAPKCVGQTSTVTLEAGVPVVKSFDLVSDPNEVVVYNGDFEEISAVFAPVGWELFIDDDGANPTMYTFGSNPNQNTTPGGSASTYIQIGDRNPEIPYWAYGWIQLDVAHRVPVDPEMKYNFYFKAKKTDWSMGFWKLSWQDDTGHEVGHVEYPTWWWLPEDKWAQTLVGDYGGRAKPMLRMVPPEGATYVTPQIGISNWPGDDANRFVTIYIDDLVIDSVSGPPNRISDIKDLNVGDSVEVTGKQLTAIYTDGSGIPADTAYIEEADRAAGIRCDISEAGELYLGFGDKVNVKGTFDVTAAGEPVIKVTAMDWVGDTRPIEALAMNNRFASQKLAEGLFVKLTGTVVDGDSRVGVAEQYFLLDDGSVKDGEPIYIKVYTGVITAPAVGDVVKVRGVLGIEADGRVLYMKNEPVDLAPAAQAFQALPLGGPVSAARDYLFLGPFGDPIDDYVTQFDTVYIPETTVRPSLGDVTNGKAWFRHDGNDEVVDLNRVFGTDHCTIYAHVYIWSPTARTVDLPIGSDDSCKVWVNGDEVGQFLGLRGAWYGSSCFTGVQLNAGFNSLLIKVVQNDGGFGVVTQVAEPGTYTGDGWGNSTPAYGIGYVLNKP